MDLNNINDDWQKEVPMLAAIEKTNPFIVPSGYFNQLSSQLNSQIYILNINNSAKTVFELPENYFNTLPNHIVSLINLEKLTDNSETEIFTVPEDYFSTLEEKVKFKIDDNKKKSAKPIIRTIVSRWTSYAAAASILAIIGFGLYFNHNNTDLNAQIAALPPEEIVTYLQLYSDADDAAFIIENLGEKPELSELGPKISDQEIKQYLESNL